jgi:hypothetical protein
VSRNTEYLIAFVLHKKNSLGRSQRKVPGGGRKAFQDTDEAPDSWTPPFCGLTIKPILEVQDSKVALSTYATRLKSFNGGAQHTFLFRFA